MNKKPIRVGFDLDGVILYNPARIVRPLIATVKKTVGGKQKTKFYIPTRPLEIALWNFLHRSSLFVAPGLEDVKQMVREKKIEAYIVTARYSFLHSDLDHWLTKIEAKKYFTAIYANKDNEQPHLFKERLLKQLDLDIFIEDNWDIVSHLRDRLKIYWIYNIVDRRIAHPYKFSDLAKATTYLKNYVEGSKKKVLIVSDYFFPHWTGLSKSMLDWTQALKKKIDFTVLTVRHDKKLKHKETVKDIPVIRANYLFPLSRAKYSLQLLFQSIDLIKKNDVVLINSPCSNILAIAIITHLLGKKLLIFHQGDLILPKGFFNRFLEKLFDAFTKPSFWLADGVSTYTEDYATHSRILRRYLKKFTPLLPPNTSSKLEAGSWKQIQKLKQQGKIVFGFAGRFVEEKGFDILLEAIPSVIKKIPNAHFVFAGETDIAYEKTFEHLESTVLNLKSNLTMLGLLKEEEMKGFYRAIDFIVIPSRSDCFNLVQADAMREGTPSVVADIPGASYLVKKTGFGKLFKKEDPKDLAAKLVEAVRDRSKLHLKHKKVINILNDPQNATKIEHYLSL